MVVDHTLAPYCQHGWQAHALLAHIRPPTTASKPSNNRKQQTKHSPDQTPFSLRDMLYAWHYNCTTASYPRRLAKKPCLPQTPSPLPKGALSQIPLPPTPEARRQALAASSCDAHPSCVHTCAAKDCSIDTKLFMGCWRVHQGKTQHKRQRTPGLVQPGVRMGHHIRQWVRVASSQRPHGCAQNTTCQHTAGHFPGMHWQLKMCVFHRSHAAAQ